jgi:hypothetical protein
VRRDAALELLEAQARLLGDAADRGVHLGVAGLEVESVDHALDQPGLDQPLEDVGLELQDLGFRQPRLAHLPLDARAQRRDLRDQHDVAPHLGRDPVDQHLLRAGRSGVEEGREGQQGECGSRAHGVSKFGRAG